MKFGTEYYFIKDILLLYNFHPFEKVRQPSSILIDNFLYNINKRGENLTKIIDVGFTYFLLKLKKDSP